MTAGGAGIVAFTQLQRTAAFLAIFLVIMMGALWVVEGFVALFSLGRAESKGLTIFFALISIIAGFTLISSPLMGAVFLVLVDGAARTWFAPMEIPVGVITAFVGGPFFIAMLWRGAVREDR